MTTTDQTIEPEVADVTESVEERTATDTERLHRRVKSFLFATVVLLLVAAAVLAFLNRRHDDIAKDAELARTVGVTHVEELLSFNHKGIDDELADERAWLTGDFASEYRTLMEDKIIPAAKQAGVVTQARVVAGGIESAEHDEVDLLLFVTVQTESTELKEPRMSGSRLRVTLMNVDGDWRISALDPV